jgi:hypothetical protein
MCRYRVSLWQAEQLAVRCRNLVWNERDLTQSDAIQLLDALEDIVSDIRQTKRRRWVKRWNRIFGAEFGYGIPKWK